MAKWAPRKWYWSHICGVRPDPYDPSLKMYDIYCPISKAVKKNVRANCVRPMADPERHLTRADYIKNSVKFWYEGDADIPLSQWVVRRVKHAKNVFTCSRVVPETCPGPNIDDFEIAYVIAQVRDEEERIRTMSRYNRGRSVI